MLEAITLPNTKALNLKLVWLIVIGADAWPTDVEFRARKIADFASTRASYTE